MAVSHVRGRRHSLTLSPSNPVLLYYTTVAVAVAVAIAVVVTRSLWRSHMCAVDGTPGLLECPEQCAEDTPFEECSCEVI